jgi:hypothetical protein
VSENGPAVLPLLAAGEPTAVAQVKVSVAKCGIAADAVDGAQAEFVGG